MTCAVAIRVSDRVLVAADSAVDCGSHIETTPDKVFRCGSIVVAVSGDLIFGQLVRAELGARWRGGLHAYASKTLAPKIQAIKRAAGGFKEDISGELLLARGREMVTINELGEVFVPTRDYLAIGSGCSFAYGALRNSSGDAVTRATMAILTAADFLGDVRPPIVCEWT